MKKLMVALLTVAMFLGLTGSVATAGEPTPGVQRAQPAYMLAWADEFNASAGSRPGVAKWRVEQVDLGDTEQQSYVDDRRTSFHDGQGNMVLRAIQETSATGRPYISGRLSNGFVGQNGTGAQPYFHTHGRWVARMLVPQGQGIWPAFWGLGNWATFPSWPYVGEIDAMETLNSADVSHGGLHTVAAADNASHLGFGQSTVVSRAGTSYAHAWHVWSLDWAPGVITWSIDGVPWQTITRQQVEAGGGRWLFDGDRPMALILNLAVGGWAGPAAGWTELSFKIDYVRIYRLNTTAITPPSRRPGPEPRP